VIDTGTGPAVLVIPGIQGRWEWMRPAIDALSRSYRVLSFSLNETTGEPAFDAWDRHIDNLLDRTGVARAALVGVSFGGLVAAHYAAARKDRVTALVMVSSPAPDFPIGGRRLSYVEHPIRSAIPFAIRGIRNLMPEIVRSRGTWPARGRLLAAHLSRVVRYPASPRRMATWVKAWQSTPGCIDCSSIRVPTLVITGEQHLDRVVPTSSTVRYLDLIAGAKHMTLDGTGHIGLICKPDAFADVVGKFLACV
jgi:pimeloyl-ACP methyl ester carboxylesterase